MPTGGHTSTLSPDDCQTAIDAVMFEEYTRTEQPGYLSAQNDFFFKQSTTDSMAFIWDEDSNVGEFQITGEQEEILNSDTRIGNTTTKRVTKFTKQIPISWEAFKTSQQGKRDAIGRQVGDRARLTQDHQALLNSYADAFAGTINTTPDGAAPASNSHTTLTGVTVDNLETGTLSADNLWTVVQSLANQKAQDGDAGSHVFEGILVPFILYKTCKEVMNSSLVPFSAENQINIFDTDYGTVRIAASIFLGSTYNSNSNANTSYHAIGRNHMWNRKVLSGLFTTMIPPENSANDTYALRARYLESVFPGSFTGYVASNGTASS